MASEDRKTRPDPFLVDADTAPLNAEEIRRLRPAREVLEELGVSVPDETAGGTGANEVRSTVTLKIDADIAARLTVAGADWPRLANRILRAWLDTHGLRDPHDVRTAAVTGEKAGRGPR